MEKEYGKISEDQFRRLVERLPEFRAADGEIKELLRSANKEKLREILGTGKPWSSLYELPFANHVAFVLVALGQKKWLESLKDAEDPPEEALMALDLDEDIEWTGGEGGEFTVGDVVGLTATHEREDRQAADAKKAKALGTAGVQVVRWQAKAIPDLATIQRAFMPKANA